jgi:hypothetical protein
MKKKDWIEEESTRRVSSIAPLIRKIAEELCCLEHFVEVSPERPKHIIQLEKKLRTILKQLCDSHIRHIDYK